MLSYETYFPQLTGDLALYIGFCGDFVCVCVCSSSFLKHVATQIIKLILNLVNQVGLRKTMPRWSPRMKDFSVEILFNCVKENIGNSQQSLLIEIFVFTL